MFSAIFFIVGMAIIFAVTILAVLVYGIYELFIKPDALTTGATRSRDIQH